MTTDLKKTVATRLGELGLAPTPLAISSGLERNYINDILTGKKRTVRGDNFQKLAAALQWTSGELLEALSGAPPSQKRDGLVPAGVSLAPARLQGIVEAGTWREFEDLDQSEPQFVYGPRDPEFPEARMMAWDVRGTSMNALTPRAIQDGDRIIAVDFDDTGMAVAHNMVVIVQQTLNAGHLREISVKQVALFDDRIEFQPRSTDPKHKPIIVKRDLHADDGRTVEVLGLVRRVVNEIPLTF